MQIPDSTGAVIPRRSSSYSISFPDPQFGSIYADCRIYLNDLCAKVYSSVVSSPLWRSDIRYNWLLCIFFYTCVINSHQQ